MDFPVEGSTRTRRRKVPLLSAPFLWGSAQLAAYLVISHVVTSSIPAASYSLPVRVGDLVAVRGVHDGSLFEVIEKQGKDSCTVQCLHTDKVNTENCRLLEPVRPLWRPADAHCLRLEKPAPTNAYFDPPPAADPDSANEDGRGPPDHGDGAAHVARVVAESVARPLQVCPSSATKDSMRTDRVLSALARAHAADKAEEQRKAGGDAPAPVRSGGGATIKVVDTQLFRTMNALSADMQRRLGIATNALMSSQRSGGSYAGVLGPLGMGLNKPRAKSEAEIMNAWLDTYLVAAVEEVMQQQAAVEGSAVASVAALKWVESRGRGSGSSLQSSREEHQVQVDALAQLARTSHGAGSAGTTPGVSASPTGRVAAAFGVMQARADRERRTTVDFQSNRFHETRAPLPNEELFAVKNLERRKAWEYGLEDYIERGSAVAGHDSALTEPPHAAKVLTVSPNYDANTGEFKGVGLAWVLARESGLQLQLPAAGGDDPRGILYRNAQLWALAESSNPAKLPYAVVDEEEVARQFGAGAVSHFFNNDLRQMRDQRLSYVQTGYWNQNRGSASLFPLLIVLIVLASLGILFQVSLLVPLGKDPEVDPAWMREAALWEMWRAENPDEECESIADVKKRLEEFRFKLESESKGVVPDTTTASTSSHLGNPSEVQPVVPSTAPVEKNQVDGNTSQENQEDFPELRSEEDFLQPKLSNLKPSSKRQHALTAEESEFLGKQVAAFLEDQDVEGRFERSNSGTTDSELGGHKGLAKQNAVKNATVCGDKGQEMREAALKAARGRHAGIWCDRRKRRPWANRWGTGGGSDHQQPGVVVPGSSPTGSATENSNGGLLSDFHSANKNQQVTSYKPAGHEVQIAYDRNYPPALAYPLPGDDDLSCWSDFGEESPKRNKAPRSSTDSDQLHFTGRSSNHVDSCVPLYCGFGDHEDSQEIGTSSASSVMADFHRAGNNGNLSSSSSSAKDLFWSDYRNSKLLVNKRDGTRGSGSDELEPFPEADEEDLEDFPDLDENSEWADPGQGPGYSVRAVDPAAIHSDLIFSGRELPEDWHPPAGPPSAAYHDVEREGRGGAPARGNKLMSGSSDEIDDGELEDFPEMEDCPDNELNLFAPPANGSNFDDQPVSSRRFHNLSGSDDANLEDFPGMEEEEYDHLCAGQHLARGNNQEQPLLNQVGETQSQAAATSGTIRSTLNNKMDEEVDDSVLGDAKNGRRAPHLQRSRSFPLPQRNPGDSTDSATSAGKQDDELYFQRFNERWNNGKSQQKLAMPPLAPSLMSRNLLPKSGLDNERSASTIHESHSSLEQFPGSGVDSLQKRDVAELPSPMEDRKNVESLPGSHVYSDPPALQERDNMSFVVADYHQGSSSSFGGNHKTDVNLQYEDHDNGMKMLQQPRGTDWAHVPAKDLGFVAQQEEQQVASTPSTAGVVVGPQNKTPVETPVAPSRTPAAAAAVPQVLVQQHLPQTTSRKYSKPLETGADHAFAERSTDTGGSGGPRTNSTSTSNGSPTGVRGHTNEDAVYATANLPPKRRLTRSISDTNLYGSGAAAGKESERRTKWRDAKQMIKTEKAKNAVKQANAVTHVENKWNATTVPALETSMVQQEYSNREAGLENDKLRHAAGLDTDSDNFDCRTDSTEEDDVSDRSSLMYYQQARYHRFGHSGESGDWHYSEGGPYGERARKAFVMSLVTEKTEELYEILDRCGIHVR
ncbi:unnamed protein product [Amoebophrya sp. A120]|nr:unnamed protein product [Amoebophrya sp. A120]|eukprot:GSA120T00005212001.1